MKHDYALSFVKDSSLDDMTLMDLFGMGFDVIAENAYQDAVYITIYIYNVTQQEAFDRGNELADIYDMQFKDANLYE